jgi:hypothetical protein
MVNKVAAFAACLSLATAFPFPWAKPAKNLVPRQGQAGAPIYPENGTLVDPPTVTNFTRPNPTYTTDQITELKLALTTAERIALLASYGSPNDYFKFDLTPNGSQSNAANGLGGQGYLAFVQNWPLLIGTGISVAIGYLNPCGLDSIHLHNRADELVTLVQGQSLKTGFVLEDGYGECTCQSLGGHQLNTGQTNQSTLRSGLTRPRSAPRALFTGSLMTTANQLCSLRPSQAKTPGWRVQLKTSLSTHKQSLMPILHTQAGSWALTLENTGLSFPLHLHRVRGSVMIDAVSSTSQTRQVAAHWHQRRLAMTL